MTLRLSIREKAFAGAAAPVLQDVSLSLGAREIVALLGPSGCGKTTLLRIVAGIDRHYAGTLEWTCAAPRIGLVFQEPRLLPWRSIRDNLRLVLPQRRMWPQADALLRDYGLWAVRDALPGALSLGMARRVAIARALAVAPDLLLLDEPFVSLDPAAAGNARAIVQAAWNARPMAILLVTHEATEAAALADRVLVLAPNPGRIVAEIDVPEHARRLDPAAQGNDEGRRAAAAVVAAIRAAQGR